MGQQHNELRRSPLSQALARAIGDTRYSGLERYGETLQPVIDLWRLPEWAFLRREATGQRGIVVAAGGAGTFAGFTLINPAGSGRLVIVLSAQVAMAAGGTDFEVSQDDAATLNASFATALVATSRDTRLGEVNPGMATVNIGNPAVFPVGNRLHVGIGLVNTPIDLPVAGIVLSPGFGLLVQNGDDAALLRGSIAWRERVALPGELG